MIRLYTGPMFSGKSTKLIDSYKSGGAWVALKPKCDVRYDINCIVSHEQRRIPATIVNQNQLHLYNPAPEVEHILVDEGQFFDDLLEGCLKFAAAGIDVRVAALNGTARQEPWPSVSRLIPYVDQIKHFYSRCCVCRGIAPFTILNDPETKLGSGSVLIGGKDVYAPACRAHLKP